MTVKRILISKEGYLSIHKMDKIYKQYCPYKKDRCGLDCPLFSPPVHINTTSPYAWELEICNNQTIEAMECVIEGTAENT